MPWWAWLVLGFVLLASELASPSGFYLLFAGIAAIIVGLLGLGELSGPPWAQWLLFTLISVLGVTLLRSRLARGFNRADAMVDDSLVGQIVTLTDRIEAGGVGQGEHRGSVWTVQNLGSQVLEVGARCTVDEVNGVTLGVRAPPAG
ncbi:MAG: NfeD family protein [Myxococcales bacterium]|nr:NfeD family protein [Myxococcales bacterium]